MNNSIIKSEFCDELAKQIKCAEDWLENHVKPKNSQADLLTIREVGDLGRHARRLHSGFNERSCLALYGASQAGKSWVANGLAAKYGEKLQIKLGSKDLDFLAEIDPGGGEETTAVVTRFTCENPPATDNTFPAQIKLISEVDIIKILINTCYSDIDYDKSDDSPQQYFEDAYQYTMAESPGSGPQSNQPILDILDVREYINREFRTHAGKFQEEFWEKLKVLLPFNPNGDDRAKILSPLWGGIPKLNELFTKLYQGLFQLGFSNQVYAELSALIPSQNSIIRMETLLKILFDNNDLSTVALKKNDGQECNLSPPILSALTAELVFLIDKNENNCWPFLKYSDILDFPGARSRESVTLDKLDISSLNKPEDVNKLAAKMFVRGKVEYLFHRYTEKSSINSMLVCISAAINQEVEELSKLISYWVERTFGRTPEERGRFSNDRPGLIFSLTKFDDRLDAPSTQSSQQKWGSLGRSTMERFVGNHYFETWKKVVTKYSKTESASFDNITLFYNSANFKIEKYFDYNENQSSIFKQSGFKENAEKSLQSELAVFLQQDLIKKHIFLPEDVWKGVLQADGGLKYLADRISASFPKDLKTKQIVFNLMRLIDEILEKMEKFHFKDKTTEMKKIEENLCSLEKSLIECHEQKAVGQFFCSLATDERFCYRHLLAADKLQKIKTSNSNPLASAQEQAEYLEKVWIEEISNYKKESTYLERYCLNAETMKLIFEQLGVAFKRLEISNTVRQELYEILSHHRPYDETLPQRAKICSEKLSEFIRHLGIDNSALERSAENKPSSDRPFPPRSFQDLPPLEEDIQEHDKQYLDYWFARFRRAIELNLDHQSGEYGPKANKQLSEILNKLTTMKETLNKTFSQMNTSETDNEQ